MAIAFSHRGALWIVLDEENVGRVQEYDPFEFNGRKTPGVLSLQLPLRVVIAYAKKEELPRLAALQRDPNALVLHLRRGYKLTASDHTRGDDVYEPLKG